MPATLTNKAINTASMVNRAFGSQSLTWNQATFISNAATGTWSNPYTLTNKSLNTATMTNKALS